MINLLNKQVFSHLIFLGSLRVINFPIIFTGTIENSIGNKYWFLNGRYHRTDGPAVEYSDGSNSWYLNGLLHRTDGPAIEWTDGTKLWWLNDKQYPEEEWKEEVEKLNDKSHK